MNEEHRKKQKFLTVGGIVLVVVIFLISSYAVISEHFESQEKGNSRSYVTTADLPLDSIDPKEIWVNQIRTENEFVQGKVDFMQDMFVNRMKNEAEKESATQNEIKSLKEELISLRSEVKKYQASTVQETLKKELRSVSSSSVSLYEENDPFGNFQPIPEQLFEPISSVICPDTKSLHHVEKTIPTGTTVKAILLSSVDIPCGVRGSSDPLPVKLRIIADARLPHGVRARLKSGIVTASVYGELSSERAYFRLEKLTQIKPDGHFIETQVAGYVSGEDGKYGLRGVVVDKSCQLVESALLSGFLSGASNFFETAAAAQLSPGCCFGDNNSLRWGRTAGQVGIAGGSSGVSNALDVLTDYFIKRAEQLRPVIEITPGRIVDITFSDSADLGDLYTHERVRNSGKGEARCRS